MGAVEDVTIKLAATFGLTGDALKDARTALAAGPLTTYLRWMQSQLQAHGGVYFADNRLTVADLKVFTHVRGLNSGNLDHVPTSLVETVAPLLNVHMRMVGATPAIAQYYAKSA
jgi:glutathione S-transferase